MGTWEEVALETFRLAVPGGWIYRWHDTMILVDDDTKWTPSNVGGEVKNDEQA